MRYVYLALVGGFYSIFSATLGFAQEPARSPVETYWCYRCHGPTGTSANSRIPNLAGQKPAYIVNQLKSFQQGDPLGGADSLRVPRVHRLMGFNAQRLSPTEIQRVAEFYAKQACRNPDASLSVDNRVPPVVTQCVACHGENGIGREAHIPNLAAQNYGYLIVQLKRFNETVIGVRNEDMKDWRQHPKMSTIAGLLSKNEMEQAARYYSKLSCE